MSIGGGTSRRGTVRGRSTFSFVGFESALFLCHVPLSLVLHTTWQSRLRSVELIPLHVGLLLGRELDNAKYKFRH
jgi:hypothetical protein